MSAEAKLSVDQPTELELLRLNLERMDASVEGEYVENDRRLNWFLLFQAFLFQGYATALQTLKEESLLSFATKQTVLLIAVIILVGFATSVLTLLSTRAGVAATERLKKIRKDKYEGLTDKYGICRDGWFSLDDKLHHAGLLPTEWGPPLVLVAWAALGGYAIATALP